jgi:hypothetical protein
MPAPLDGPEGQPDPEAHSHEGDAQAKAGRPQEQGYPREDWYQSYANDGAENLRPGNLLCERRTQRVVKRNERLPDRMREQVQVPELPEELHLGG